MKRCGMSINLTLAFSMMLIWLFPHPSYAQRGIITDGNPKNFTSPTQGFPGFFDSNFAEKGSVVVEWPPVILPVIPVPSVAVDYGVSDTLTVGSNALVTAVPWLLGGKGFSLKVRTLVYGSEDLLSAATVYAGYLSASNVSGSWQVFTSNTSWKPGPRHILTGQAMFASLGVESGKNTDVDYTNLRLSSLGLGGSYQFILSNSIAFSGSVMAPAWTSIEADTVAANLDANMNATSGQLMWGLARGSVDIRTTNWVYSIGGMYFHGFVGKLIPWFSATKRW